MANAAIPVVHALSAADKLLIGGQWIDAASSQRAPVIDATTGGELFSVAVGNAEDMSRAIAAARDAFDRGPWPRMAHAERAEFLNAIARGIRDRAEDLSQLWPRESGVLYADARAATASTRTRGRLANLAGTFRLRNPEHRLPVETLAYLFANQLASSAPL